MRSELGKITLDKTFEEREALNANIVAAINGAAEAWGLTCLRYEIKDITPPRGIINAMELQVKARCVLELLSTSSHSHASEQDSCLLQPSLLLHI
jgi:regulator of protease activity HflC (stomatin/prohibitin superfamily)